MSQYCNCVLHFKEKDEFQVCQWQCYDRCSAKDYNERRLSRKSMSSSPSGSGSPGNSLEEGEEEEEVGVGSNFTTPFQNIIGLIQISLLFCKIFPNITQLIFLDFCLIFSNITQHFEIGRVRGRLIPTWGAFPSTLFLRHKIIPVALCKWYKPVTLHLFCHFLWYFIANTYTRYSFNHSYLVGFFLFLSTSVKQ